MALSDELEALAKRHGALSYSNRADTQNPAFGFSVAGLESLLAEVRKDDEALIEQCRAALAEELAAWDIDPPLQHVKDAHDACVARLGEKP
mgnify:CR=1 FL=1